MWGITSYLFVVQAARKITNQWSNCAVKQERSSQHSKQRHRLGEPSPQGLAVFRASDSRSSWCVMVSGQKPLGSSGGTKVTTPLSRVTQQSLRSQPMAFQSRGSAHRQVPSSNASRIAKLQPRCLAFLPKELGRQSWLVGKCDHNQGFTSLTLQKIVRRARPRKAK